MHRADYPRTASTLVVAWVSALVAGVLGAVGLTVTTAVVAPTPAGATAADLIATGEHFACSVFNGAAKCWGDNTVGQLGDSTTTQRLTPVQVVGLTTGVTAIAAGRDSACAVVAGAAKCWGSLFSSSTPVDVPSLSSNVSAISVGLTHACAVVGGAAKCWGDNSSGQLGNGTTTSATTPTQVTGLTSNVTAISAGGYLSCAVQSGAAFCWGANTVGQLGTPVSASSPTPVQVPGLGTQVTRVSAGAVHACAIVAGAVMCWGLPNGGILINPTPLLPTIAEGITAGATDLNVSPSIAFQYKTYVLPVSCAVVSAVARCWGFNPIVQGSGLLGTVSRIAVNTENACATTQEATLCWGRNDFGQIGNGTTSFDVKIPSPVFGTLTRPLAPSYSGVDLVSSTSVRIRWTDNSAVEDGYLVYRVVGSSQTLVSGCSFSTPNLNSCIDTGLIQGTYYQYYVYAFNSVGATSPGTYLLTRTASGAPKISAAVATGTNTVLVSWLDESADETAFKVYRYTGGQYILETTTGANATSATITDLTMNTATPQIFIVSAITAAGERYADTYIFTTARAAATGVVAAPSLGPATTSATTATISWTDNANNESGYLVYRVEGSMQFHVPDCPTTTPNLTRCTDPGLAPDTYFQYYVYAWNASGVGDTGTSIVVHTPRLLPDAFMTDATGTTASTITVHWQDNANDETGYVVYEYAGGTFTAVATLAADSTVAVLTGLAPSTTHVYVVAAIRGTAQTYSPNALWATTLT